ncbi:hypothetical protein PAHAL_2G225700 [Panicum hallii]|uniref:Uncharacterized protein n=1 Tax=Panicum hallii TaxID=206008 RepID=A0A2T8KQ12_9POAL|nr:hypothetical protein PAHAL_2G225700 [Panicum hallii]
MTKHPPGLKTNAKSLNSSFSISEVASQCITTSLALSEMSICILYYSSLEAQYRII